MSTVSVIIPCYNYAHFLRDCVESVLTQPVDLRVLIIDDASSDSTSQVAAELAARDPRVERLCHQVNRGHITTYNEGLEWAAGDYTLLLSADDLLTPGALLRATRLLDAHPEVGFVYGRGLKYRVGDPLPRPTTVSGECDWEVQTGLEFLRSICRQGDNPVSTPTAVVRTSLQHRLGGYRHDLPHTGDLEMWLRFAAHGSVGYLHADQAVYRFHAANMHIHYFTTSLADLRQRHAAFESIFQNYGGQIRECDQLRCSVSRSLVCDALWQASLAFDRGDLASSREAEDFVRQTYPDYGAWSECRRACRGLRCRQWMGRRAHSTLRKFISRLRTQERCYQDA